MRLFFASVVLCMLPVMLSCSDDKLLNQTPVYRLSATADPEEAGSVSPAEGEYEEGEEVEIMASANDHWVFVSWQGDYSGTSNPDTVIMSSDRTITALFGLRDYTLNIETRGEGIVQEQLLKQKTDYEAGSVVELTAAAENGWRFSHWEGDFEGDDNPAVIEMDREKSVTAVFERQEYALTIVTEGEGAVSEEVVTAKATDYPFGSLIELTASPADGWKFVRWEGALTGGDNPAQIEMTEPKEVTAVFELQRYELTIETDGNGSVSEQLINGSRDGDDYEHGSVVEMTATAEEGWFFVRWQGGFSGNDNPAQIEMTEPKEVTAVFERQLHELAIDTEGNGSVSAELISGNQTGNEYEHGSVVELAADANFFWVFDRWEGDLSGDENPARITITESMQITAVFRFRFFSLRVETEGNGSVSEDLVSGEENEDGYTAGSVVKLTVSPANNWSFDRWGGDISGSDNPVEITINGNTTATAHLVNNRGNRGNRGGRGNRGNK